MSDGVTLVFIVLLALIFGKLAGIKTQMKRIADFCERAEKRSMGQ